MRKNQADTLLAHVRVLRLTDRLLDVAAELREARTELERAMKRTNEAANTNRKDGNDA